LAKNQVYVWIFTSLASAMVDWVLPVRP
jgi:hypothetical protein